MISCEHFLYSLSTGLITTPNIQKLLTPLELDFLCHIGDQAETVKCFRTKINKLVLALTYIEPVKDEYNRKDVWNHTILIEYECYFDDREVDPLRLVGVEFVQAGDKPRRSLEPIKL